MKKLAKKLMCWRTDHGFDWGVTSVNRACEINGHIVIEVVTPRQRLMVRVTPTGFIRPGEIEPNEGERLSVEI